MWAVMDIGTNSTRLLLAKQEKLTGKIVPVKRMLSTTRIGQGLSSENRVISLTALERTLEALEQYRQVIATYPVATVLLIGTQALRQASNSEGLVELIRAKWGWELHVISGEREAWLSYLGAIRGLAKVSQTTLVMDIGGGSTEFIYRDQRGVIKAASLPLGALRQMEHRLTEKALREIITSGLSKEAIPEGIRLVGVGGTCTSVAAVKLGLKTYDGQKVQGCSLDRQEVIRIYHDLKHRTMAQRLEVFGIYPGREDIIVPGMEILMAALTYLNKSEIIISDEDLLFGLIYEVLV